MKEAWMTTPNAPRHFMPSPALPGAGLPSDRVARLAARRSFVTLKQRFIEAVSDLPGHSGAWLRQQVRGAEEPGDLWLLRAPVFEALAGDAQEYRTRRRQLRRGLESMFPDSELASAFTPF
ncbi:MAG: hypothetical protein KGL43_17560 [Burkholderiales bacterium]|nr:hypothetical protein [Burkholderiales bacterium]MDE2394538.1 hypothetical protein [Burkholderiales bacterium]MDE2455396.1 hypothetical protein [Burkholderiales bacterium]